MYGMKKRWLIFYFMPVVFAQAQSINEGSVISGPMLGQVELRTASLWIQVSSDITSVALSYWKQGHPETSWKKIYDGTLGKEFNPIRMDIGGLDINSRLRIPVYIKSTKIFCRRFISYKGSLAMAQSGA